MVMEDTVIEPVSRNEVFGCIIPHATITMPDEISKPFSTTDIKSYVARHIDEDEPLLCVSVALLHDGRYVVMRRAGQTNVSLTLSDIVRFGLTDPERKVLGLEISVEDDHKYAKAVRAIGQNYTKKVLELAAPR